MLSPIIFENYNEFSLLPKLFRCIYSYDRSRKYIAAISEGST